VTFEVEEVDAAVLLVVVDVATLLVVVEVDCSEVELVVVFDLGLAPESAKYAPAATTIITTSATAAMVVVPMPVRVFSRFSPGPNFAFLLRRPLPWTTGRWKWRQQ